MVCLLGDSESSQTDKEDDPSRVHMQKKVSQTTFVIERIIFLQASCSGSCPCSEAFLAVLRVTLKQVFWRKDKYFSSSKWICSFAW